MSWFQRVGDELARRWKFIVGLFALSVTGLVFLLSVKLAGVVSTLVYTTLFVGAALIIPTTVALGAPSFPRAMRQVFGKLHFVLGQLAFGIGVLVQHRTEWKMHPARRTTEGLEVWMDDLGWVGGVDDAHLTILGWSPFGILFDKGTDTALVDVRGDDTAETKREKRGVSADGGTQDIERGGYEQVARPAEINGEDTWLLDLKRVWSRGLAKFGDIALIEKIEEITIRKQAQGGRSSTQKAIIGSIVGLVLGVATGYVMLVGA